jgi:eukaryotic-like serine/threonine-protein kinase
MIGARINNYEVRSLLGQGGMGAVYAAEHPVLGRRVAIKVLHPEFAKDTTLVGRFHNEARAANAIGHPNIIDVIDVGTLPDGLPYLMMELLEGESLRDRLRRLVVLPVASVLEIMVQAASALGAAHAKGIVHRDLKPDNLFATRGKLPGEPERLKVLDFGIAKLRNDFGGDSVKTRTGALIGTPLYMSPEQCRGLAQEVDHRTDIYALGVIVYELLCGAPPFQAQGWGDLLMKHVSEPPRPPVELNPAIPAHVNAAVLRALGKRREDRFASMGELAQAFLGPQPNTLVLDGDARLAPAGDRLGPTMVLPVPSALPLPERGRPVTTFSDASLALPARPVARRSPWPWILAGAAVAAAAVAVVLSGAGTGRGIRPLPVSATPAPPPAVSPPAPAPPVPEPAPAAPPRAAVVEPPLPPQPAQKPRPIRSRDRRTSKADTRPVVGEPVRTTAAPAPAVATPSVITLPAEPRPPAEPPRPKAKPTKW